MIIQERLNSIMNYIFSHYLAFKVRINPRQMIDFFIFKGQGIFQNIQRPTIHYL